MYSDSEMSARNILSGLGTPAAGDTIVGTGGRGTWAHRGIYGDGSDGSVTDTGAGTHLREYYFANWTLNGAAAVDTRGNPNHVNGLLDIIGAPVGALVAMPAATNSASVATAGAAPAAYNCAVGGGGITLGGSAGSGGATGVGTATTGGNQSGGYGGGLPGTVGTAGSGSSGAGGVCTQYVVIGPAATPRTGEFFTSGCGYPSVQGSSAGGDGTATASGAGAGSALGGIGVVVYCRQFARSALNLNAGVIQAKGRGGGDGGTPAAGNRGGGCPSAGGGGGLVRIVCEELIGTTHVNCADVSGGSGGTGGAKTGTGTDGGGAGPGFGGQCIRYVGGATPVSTVTSQRATSGSAPSGRTGGTATAAQCDL